MNAKEQYFSCGRNIKNWHLQLSYICSVCTRQETQMPLHFTYWQTNLHSHTLIHIQGGPKVLSHAKFLRARNFWTSGPIFKCSIFLESLWWHQFKKHIDLSWFLSEFNLKQFNNLLGDKTFGPPYILQRRGG